jgi:hypothetical protein
MPKPMKITGRSSSITNAFINSIIPVVPPTEDEIEEALAILGMTADTIACAYCGDTASEWDHLRPLVKAQRPTGFISEIRNLVPSCGKCNQSKGNKDWESWMRSAARLSPSSRRTLGMEARIEKLKQYEAWGTAAQVDLKSVVGNDLWDRHWQNWQRVLEEMRQSQALADEINKIIRHAYRNP